MGNGELRPAPSDGHDPTGLTRSRRPWLTAVVFGTLTLWSLLGWLRLAQAIQGRGLILTLIPTGIFAYLIGAGAIWGLAPLPALWGLVTSAPWTPGWLWVGALAPPALYWFERLILWQESPSNTPFMLLLTLAWLGLVVWKQRSHHSAQRFDHPTEGK